MCRRWFRLRCSWGAGENKEGLLFAVIRGSLPICVVQSAQTGAGCVRTDRSGAETEVFRCKKLMIYLTCWSCQGWLIHHAGICKACVRQCRGAPVCVSGYLLAFWCLTLGFSRSSTEAERVAWMRWFVLGVMRRDLSAGAPAGCQSRWRDAHGWVDENRCFSRLLNSQRRFWSFYNFLPIDWFLSRSTKVSHLMNHPETFKWCLVWAEIRVWVYGPSVWIHLNRPLPWACQILTHILVY